MPKTPEDTTPASWHRFFGAEANNRAWQLAEDRTDEAHDRELLDAAHAAAYHWQAVGTELHRMRARMLLAHVHALVGHPGPAWQEAEAMRAYFLTQPGTPDWELAFVHAIHAHAAAVASQRQAHAASYAAARQALAALTDPQDREIVEKTFRQVPAP